MPLRRPATETSRKGEPQIARAGRARLVARLATTLCLLLAMFHGSPSAAGPTASSESRSPAANQALRPTQLAQACPPQLQKLGLCKGSSGNRRPDRGGNFSGSSVGPRVVCINGVRVGKRCACPNGGTPRRINRTTYKCTSGPRPCPKGMKRVGKLCIPSGPPPSGTPGVGSDPVVCIGGKRAGRSCICPRGSKLRRFGRNRYRCITPPRPCKGNQRRINGECVDVTPDPPTDPGRCIGGRLRRGVCDCPPPARPRKFGRNKYRCIIPPCPKDSVRKGRFCVPIVTPPPPTVCPPDTRRLGKRCIRDATPQPPPPRCRPGWRLRNGTCTRTVRSACPDGTRKRNGNCVRIPPPPRNAASPPLPRPAPAIASADDSPFEPDEVLVEIPGNAPQQVANRLIGSFGLVTLSQTRLTMLGTSLYRFRIPAGRTVEDVVAALAGQPGVETSQPNWRYTLNDGAAAGAVPRERSTRRAPAAPAIEPGERTGATLPQYALDLIDAPRANAISRGADVLVAVIDTGVDESHPELAQAIAGRFNAFPAEPFTPDTHATAIASIIAAKGEMTGIAPDARILSVQAFTATGTGEPSGGRGTSYRLALSLNWVMMKGARVVNMSFAGPPLDTQLGKFIAKGTAAGIVFVAAAGNGGPQAPPAFPAAHPDVIAVTAIGEDKELYEHANIGDYIDVAAPGVDVIAAARDGAYDLASGTSFAAAHVSAVTALLLSKSPRLVRQQILEQITQTAADLGEPGPDAHFGAGCINALKALQGVNVMTSGGAQ